jgi:hypothetical protein
VVHAEIGLDPASMIVWMGLMILGLIFIGLALRDEGRDEKPGDGSVRRIPDPRELPLKHVRDAIRPPRPARPHPPANAAGVAPHHRRPRPYRGPHGPHIVK